MELREVPLRSDALGARRTVWAEDGDGEAGTWIFLDGELYLGRVGVKDVVEDALLPDLDHGVANVLGRTAAVPSLVRRGCYDPPLGPFGGTPRWARTPET